MSTTWRTRMIATAVAGSAVTTFLGASFGPVFSADPAARLETMAQNTTVITAVYLFRMLGALLAPAVVIAVLRLVPRRGAPAAAAGGALVLIGETAGVATTTIVAVQALVLAPSDDRLTAIAVAGRLDDSSLVTVTAVLYLSGLLLGNLLLGVGLWRARAVPRWAAAAIAAGLIVHIAAGDLPWTTVGGTTLLTVGLAALARQVWRTAARTATHPGHAVV
ncbi:hypothetical protein [Actinoplanes sp. URMC 104]|uniref:hypothetical protein n=1 Tax=Actinoplanes sp. URMC 104 TaxID=3423409 RepID=UPI003F1BD418